jgi:hypothetical protein
MVERSFQTRGGREEGKTAISVMVILTDREEGPKNTEWVHPKLNPFPYSLFKISALYRE